MAKLKVTLSIGFPAATREDVIEVDDEELASCETVSLWAINYVAAAQKYRQVV